MSSLEAHAIYALAWLSFGLGHSLLAGGGAKKRLFPVFGSFHRLSYNLFAALHIALVMALGWRLFGAIEAFQLAPWARNALLIGYVLGWAAFLWALKGYDLGLLAGTKQIRERMREPLKPADEPLLIAGAHRYVRHPLYAGAFLILWGRISDEFDLATAAWASLYLVAGTFFEERKLLRLYGKEYADYRRSTPAFIPWRIKGA